MGMLDPLACDLAHTAAEVGGNLAFLVMPHGMQWQM